MLICTYKNWVYIKDKAVKDNGLSMCSLIYNIDSYQDFKSDFSLFLWWPGFFP